MSWQKSVFGGSEFIDLAEKRGRLAVSMTHTRPAKYRGVVSLEAKCNEQETSDEAKRAVLLIARRRLTQALAEVEALIEEAK